MSEKRKDSRGRVLKDGESQRSNGTYMYRYTDIRKNRKCIYAPTLEALRGKEDEIAKAKTRDADYCSGNITLLDLAKKHISQKQGVRYNTRVGYEAVLHLLEAEDFSYRIIRDIKTSEAKEWIIKLHNDGKRYSTIQSVRGVLRPAFNMAVEEDVIAKNPFSFTLTDVIPNDMVKREPLTDEEVDRFLAFVREDKYRIKHYNEIAILLGTGLRVSELYGLTVSDVDLKNRKLRVERQLCQKRSSEYYIEKPKSSSGARFIPLVDEAAYEAIKQAVENRKAEKVEFVVDGYSQFLFLGRDKQPKVAKSLEHAMRLMVKEYNLGHCDKLTVTPHILRHTFCTRMARAGMPVKELQYIMGHADVGTTLNIYTHMSYDAAAKAFEKAISNE